MSFIADEWPGPTTATVDGEPLRMFSGCNYLGLAQHPRLIAAAATGLRRHGLAANGSPLTTGKVRVHAELEVALAKFLQQPAALLVPDGHLANVAACQALATEELDGAASAAQRVALADELAHDSLAAAARAAGFEVLRFRHADAAHAAKLCSEVALGRALVLTDSLFGSSGELAPIAELLDALPQTATLLIDDGHGLGVLGPGGRGAYAAWRRALGLMGKPNSDGGDDAPYARIVLTASLSKGLGCYGGVVAGDVNLAERVRAKAGAYGGTTPVPPAIAEAALAALALLEQDSSRVSQLRQNAARLRTALGELGQRVPVAGVPVFCLALDQATTTALQHAFLGEGLGVPLVTYANGPAQQYFRIAISAEHSDSDIDRLIGCLRAVL